MHLPMIKFRPTRIIGFAGVVLAAALLASPIHAQSVGVPPSQVLLDQSYAAMYNLNFEVAFQRAEQAKAFAKDDPMPWVAQACAGLFREFDRLHILRSEMFASDETFDAREAYKWNPQTRQQFEAALTGAEKLAQDRLTQNREDAVALFALALTHGLRADDAALISKKNMAALSDIKTANGYADRLLSRWPDYYDAYVATGMGKYVIGGKAAPVRWMLRIGGIKGDQAEGLKELTLAAENGHYLAPFARILLAFDDLRHNKTTDARKIFASLHDQFPGNPLFPQEMAKIDQTARSVGPGSH
jgi:hypothetical protein